MGLPRRAVEKQPKIRSNLITSIRFIGAKCMPQISTGAKKRGFFFVVFVYAWFLVSINWWLIFLDQNSENFHHTKSFMALWCQKRLYSGIWNASVVCLTITLIFPPFSKNWCEILIISWLACLKCVKIDFNYDKWRLIQSRFVRIKINPKIAHLNIKRTKMKFFVKVTKFSLYWELFLKLISFVVF